MGIVNNVTDETSGSSGEINEGTERPLPETKQNKAKQNNTLLNCLVTYELTVV